MVMDDDEKIKAIDKEYPLIEGMTRAEYESKHK